MEILIIIVLILIIIFSLFSVIGLLFMGSEYVVKARKTYGRTWNYKKAAFRLYHTRWPSIPESFDVIGVLLCGSVQWVWQWYPFKEVTAKDNLELLK